MSSARVVHVSRTDIDATQARDARARAWKFIFDCHAKKKAAGVTSTDGDDTKGRSVNDFRAHTILHD